MPVVPIEPSPLQESPVNLVRAARNALANDETNGEWVRGFTYLPLTNAAPGGIAPCPADPSAVDLTSGIPAHALVPTWHPYIAWTAVRCSTFGFESFDWLARATEQLKLGRVKALERELWAGDLAQAEPELAENLWLAMGAQTTPVSGGRTDFGPIDVTPGSGPVSVTRGFGLLEQAMADYGLGARGVIHCQPQATPNFLNVRPEGNNLLVTHNGTIVVPGNGYAGTGPGGAVPEAGTSWMYATGIVDVRIDSDKNIKLIPDPLDTSNTDWYSQALDTRTNTLIVRAEQFVIASWDGQVHFAVHVTLGS